jgi:hypothetical protein
MVAYVTDSRARTAQCSGGTRASTSTDWKNASKKSGM